jgi:ABC-type transport system involved in multi-copper enzyme maturation permease subunit
MGMLADEWGMAQVWPNIVMLLGFAVVFFAIAVWRFKYE